VSNYSFPFVYSHQVTSIKSMLSRLTSSSTRLLSIRSRPLSTLVVAEHDGANLGAGVLSCVTAAGQVGGDCHVLVCGSGVDGVAKQAAEVVGVKKVLVVDGDDHAKSIGGE